MSAPPASPPSAPSGPGPNPLPPGRLQVFPVSSRGLANHRSSQANHGMPFGPDIPGTQTAGVQEAIDRAASLGGGVVQLDPMCSYELRAPLVLRSHIWLDAHGAVLHSAQPLPAVVTTPPGELTRGVILNRLCVNAEWAPNGWGLDLAALQKSDLDVIVVNAAHGVRLSSPAQVKQPDPLHHANVVINRFRFSMDRINGTGLLLRGESPGAVVTDNTFSEVYMTHVGACGVDLAEWVDSNLFGHVFVSLANSNTVGVVLNSAGQARNRGVSDNLFSKLSVDAFGGQGVSALRLYNSKMNVVHQLYSSPEGKEFGGTLVDDRGSESAWIYSAGESRIYQWGTEGTTPTRRSNAVSRATGPVTLISFPVPKDGTYELALAFTVSQVSSGNPRLDAYWTEDSGQGQMASLPLPRPGRLTESFPLRAKAGTMISVATIGPFQAVYSAVATLKEIA